MSFYTIHSHQHYIPMSLIFFSYLFLTIMFLGQILRGEHNRKPINEIIVIAWTVISIFGLMYTNMIGIFYYMNMVTIGWFVCEFTMGV